MRDGMRSGSGGAVRGVASMRWLWTAGLLALNTAWAQTPVVPPGSGAPGDPYRISELGHLAWMGDSTDASSGKYYRLQNGLDASSTVDWNGGAGFLPIGPDDLPFAGIFDGNGHVITNLTVNRPTLSYVGLFGRVAAGGVIGRVGLKGGTLTGNQCVGGLAGGNGGVVSECFAACTVTGTDKVGGLVGVNPGAVSNSYATGPVTSPSATGGLVGWNQGVVSRCFSAGAVTGTSLKGGLVGYNTASVGNSYWNTQTSGQAASAGGTGKTTVQMKQLATFAGWDFASVWDIAEGVTYPYLVWQARGPFAGAGDLGGGWKWLPWLGLFAEVPGGWIYHYEHRWMFVVGTSPQNVVFWTMDMGWLWTSSEVYPWMYRYDEATWLWYLKDSSAPRWFYNFTAGAWEAW